MLGALARDPETRLAVAGRIGPAWVAGLAVIVVVSGAFAMIPSAAIAAAAEPSTVPAGSVGDVSAAGNGVAGANSYSDPHPGTIEAYLTAPQGANTVDPSVANTSVDLGAIQSVFETLIAYDYNSTTSFEPTAATCVPGTIQCTLDYESSSISDYTGIFNQFGDVFTGSNGAPTFWTFVLDPAARFYNASHDVAWPVYPSDVMFSIARTLAFSDPLGSGPGGPLAEALLPETDQGTSCEAQSPVCWDPVHTPLNNTPYDVLTSMLVNSTRYCPASAMGPLGNGCVTFLADSGGALGVTAWPQFLELVADGLGASIESCGVYTSLGAGLPGWPGTHAANGDGPCKLPGGGTSTAGSAFQGFLTSVAPQNVNDSGNAGVYSWDALENRTWNDFPAVQPAVRYLLEGSGPYYGSISPATGYHLHPSPAYQQPSACGGNPTGYAQYNALCDPAPGGFIGNVNVTFEAGDAEGLQALEAGTADWASIATNQSGTSLEPFSEDGGRVEAAPGLVTEQWTYALNWSASARAADGLGGTDTVPSNFFAWSAARGLFEMSYPFATAASNIWTSGGLRALVPVGGPIPAGTGCYYAPTTSGGCQNNYTVPYSDEVNGGYVETNPLDTGGAAWWWAQGQDPSSPYYDPELANCTSVAPCRITLDDPSGVRLQNATSALWAEEIGSITGGAIQAQSVTDPNPSACLAPTADDDPCPVYLSTPVAVYPDPTAVELQYGLPNGTRVRADAVPAELSLPAFDNATLCGHAATTYRNLTYWAGYTNSTPVPTACEGVVYGLFAWATLRADTLAQGSLRTLLYDLTQSLLNALNLYTAEGQVVHYVGSAPWIAPTTVWTLPLGGSAQLWFQLKYAVLLAWSLGTFTEGGLPRGTGWTVTLDGEVMSSTARSMTFRGDLIGNATYTVTSDSAVYVPTVSHGTVFIEPQKAPRVRVQFHAVEGEVTFHIAGAAKGVPWSIRVGSVVMSGSARKVSTDLLPGSYAFVARAPGYMTVRGTVAVSDTLHPVSVHLRFSVFDGYGVTFEEAGLAPGTEWKVALKLAKGTGDVAPRPGSQATLEGVVNWTDLGNGTYTYRATAPGYRVLTGTIQISGSSAPTVDLAFVKA